MSINSVPLEPTDPRALVVGVDFGTLSGRAVVVRVADGAELGSAVTDYPHGVLDRTLPGSDRPAAARLGAAGARGLRRGAARRRARARCGPRAPTRRTSSASAPTSPPARCCRPPPTAPRCASCRSSPTGRTPTSSCGSTTPRSRRPTGSTSWPRERGEPWLPRYGGLISSEWEFAKGLQLLEEDPERLRRDGPLGRGRRLDRLAAVPAPTSATPAPPATRASTRTAATPSPDFLRRAEPRLRAASSRTSSTTRSASSATAPAG